MKPRQYQVDGSSILVSVDYMDTTARAIIKNINGRWWERDLKKWRVPLHQDNIDLLNEKLGLDILKRNAETSIQKMSGESKSLPTLIDMGEDVKSLNDYKEEDIELLQYESAIKPFRHQRYAVTMIVKKKQYGLFIEMGLGKTKAVVDAYLYLKARGELKNALIICPKPVILSWKEELEKHGEKGYVILTGTKRQRLKLLNLDKINIINYAGVLMLKDILLKFNTKESLIVLDESSKIKNPDAKRTKLITHLFRCTRYRVILSGTPITQSPIDIFSQYQFLSTYIFNMKSWYAFRNTYCEMGGYMNYKVVGYRNLPQLKEIIHRNAYILKKKDCDEVDLPEKIYEKFELEMKPNMKAMYKDMKENLVAEVNEDLTLTASIILVKLLRLHQILSGVWMVERKDNLKLMETINVIKEFSGDQKVVIFCKFIDSLKMLSEELTKEGISNETYYGETRDRDEVISRFRNTDVKVLIAQIQTAGMGLNLQCASMVIYYENTFSLQDRLQSEDRCHRTGQRNNVTYVDLVYKGTVDVDILEAIKEKKKIADYLIPSLKK